MTIKEITKLRYDEQLGLLEMPKSYQEILNKEEHKSLIRLVRTLSRDKKSFLLFVKKLLFASCGINYLNGTGDRNSPFQISTNYGDGIFYPLREFFANKQIPQFIQSNECFNNCYVSMEKMLYKNCRVLSGVAYAGHKPFLHSVVLTNDLILDYNMNLCMSKDLYLKLFCFETLSCLDMKTFKKGYSTIRRNRKYLNQNGVSTIYAVFAYEDLIRYLNEEPGDRKETLLIVKK